MPEKIQNRTTLPSIRLFLVLKNAEQFRIMQRRNLIYNSSRNVIELLSRCFYTTRKYNANIVRPCPVLSFQLTNSSSNKGAISVIEQYRTAVLLVIPHARAVAHVVKQ